ncbi:matrixin family metalloprotease [Patulibacter defluvii]|uniref:matrixin family metalloprotease n=1 Tax=Patulibacter defluvii TaxID=3095358 RepID=UPI002A747BBC|nr:matrixin family metalloprotease [Patulibacter sp. DM4]
MTYPRGALTRRILLGLSIVVGLQVAAQPAAQGHIAYNTPDDCCTRFQHQDHDRDIALWNQIGNSAWWNGARRAQLHLHEIYDGSLRFPTAGSSSSADVVLVDAYYTEAFVGRAYNWRYHGGQGRMQMNTRFAMTENQAKGTACHELSHFTGLAHSNNATDCMLDNLELMASSNLAISHRDQNRAEWNASGH